MPISNLTCSMPQNFNLEKIIDTPLSVTSISLTYPVPEDLPGDHAEKHYPASFISAAIASRKQMQDLFVPWLLPITCAKADVPAVVFCSSFFAWCLVFPDVFFCLNQGKNFRRAVLQAPIWIYPPCGNLEVPWAAAGH